MKKLLLGLGLVVLLGAGVLAQRRLVMGPAKGLGVHEGRLAACPETPNCVSTFATSRHRIEPLPLEGDPAAAMERLRRIVEGMPRTRVADVTERYLHAEAESLVWRYVDDLEVLVDAGAGEIHLRSASRTGYSDLGVNRRRVGALTEAYRVPAAGR